MRKFLFGLVIALFISITFIGNPKPAEATINICPPGQHVVITWSYPYFACVPNSSPSPSPSVTPSPSATAEPTSSPAPTEEPTSTPEPTVEPSGTPEPTVEPTASPTQTYVQVAGNGGGDGSSTGTPTCGNRPPLKAMDNFHVSRWPLMALVKWAPNEGDIAHIYYKESSAGGWQHSKSDIPNNGQTWIFLLVNPNYTFAGQQANGCAAGPLTPEVKTEKLNGLEHLFR